MMATDWLAVFVLVVMILCEFEDFESTYRERTKAMLRIAGITEAQLELEKKAYNTQYSFWVEIKKFLTGVTKKWKLLIGLIS